MDVNSDDEWDDGTTVNKDKLRAREPAFNAPKGTGGVSESDVMKGVADEDAAPTAVADSRGGAEEDSPARFKVHGAMDDYMDDEKIKQAASGEPLKKKMKRKMVEKMEVDANGYMVTNYVEEWVTDDDKSPVRKAPKAAPKPVARAAPKAKKAAAPGQKTMMGFFGAK